MLLLGNGKTDIADFAIELRKHKKENFCERRIDVIFFDKYENQSKIL